MSEFNNFKNKTLGEIRLWAWAAAVLPLTALAGLFFLWVFGTDRAISVSMVIGETIMFGTAVTWWWWTLYVLKKLVIQWGNADAGVSEVLTEVRQVKDLVKEKFPEETDK